MTQENLLPKFKGFHSEAISTILNDAACVELVKDITGILLGNGASNDPYSRGLQAASKMLLYLIDEPNTSRVGHNDLKDIVKKLEG